MSSGSESPPVQLKSALIDTSVAPSDGSGSFGIYGGSFTKSTVIVTVAIFESSKPSYAL